MADTPVFNPDSFMAGRAGTPATAAPAAPAVAFNPDEFMAKRESDQSTKEKQEGSFWGGFKNGSGIVSTIHSAFSNPGEFFGSLTGYNDAKAAKDAWDKGDKKTAAIKALSLITNNPASRVANSVSGGLVDASIDQAKKAKESFKSGDYDMAIGHAATAALPIFAGATNGVAKMKKASKEIESDPNFKNLSTADKLNLFANHPDVIEGMGMISGNVADLPLGEGIGKMITLPSAVKSKFNVDPIPGAINTFKLKSGDPAFTTRLPGAMKDILDEAPIGQDGQPVLKTPTHTYNAATEAINKHEALYDSYIANAEKNGTKVPGDAIADAYINSVPRTWAKQNPKEFGEIVDKYNQLYRGRDLSVRELDTIREDMNSQAYSHNQKGAGVRNSDTGMGTSGAEAQAVADAARELLYKAIDPLHDGSIVRSIKQRVGDLTRFRNSAKDMITPVAGEAPLTQAGAIGEAARKVANIPGQVATGHLDANPLDIRNEAFGGKTNAMIEKIFKAVKDLPKDQFPGPVNPPPLPPAPATQAALPPSSFPVGVSGVTVPDLAGQIQQGANAMNVGPKQLPEAQFIGRATQPPVRRGGVSRQLEPPTPGEPPINVQPSGPALPPRTESASATGPAANPNAIGSDTARPMPGEKSGRLQDVIRETEGNPSPEVAMRNPDTGKITYHSESEAKALRDHGRLPKDTKFYKIGDKVKLKGGGEATIKGFNSDGSFSY